MARYLRILGRPDVLLPFVCTLLARLPIAMGPLGMVLLIQHVRGSYSIAGVVTAAFALGASVATPFWGGLLDRRGQSWVIGPVSVASAAFLVALAVSAVRGAPDPALILLSAAVGLSYPPISPAMRAAWRALLDTEEDRRAAYALDAVAVETLFVGGPLLLSLLLVFAPPVVPLLVTAALLAIGGVGYALSPAARCWRPEPHRHGPGHRGPAPLRVPGVLVVVVTAASMAVGFGLCDVSIAATAREVLGSQARVGMLFAAIAGGSAIGGLWYGSRAWRRPDHSRLPVALTGFAFGLVALGVLLVSELGSTAALLPVLFGTGLCVAPCLIIFANLVDQRSPRDRLGEAQSWLNTAFTSGGALGTALSGLLVDTGGPARGFLGAGAAVLLALALSIRARQWSPPQGPDTPAKATSTLSVITGG